jgi:hypothetical protein
MIRKMLAAAVIVAAPLSLAPATAQAQTYFTAADMNISIGSDGSISTNFGQSGILAGMFQHIYQFTLPQSGLASGSITTSATFPGGGIDDLDIISVFFNGVLLTGITGGINEVVFANSVPVVGGMQNEIIINGFSRGNGSYGGQGVFAPNAVPEPAAWAMLIGGFGFAGLATRRHVRTKVSYSKA